MTHEQLFLKLINDENIYDNLEVSDDYIKDKWGNSLITVGFESPSGKKPVEALLMLVFNIKGRLINMEVSTREKGKKKWQIATSENLINFTLKGFTG